MCKPYTRDSQIDKIWNLNKCHFLILTLKQRCLLPGKWILDLNLFNFRLTLIILLKTNKLKTIPK